MAKLQHLLALCALLVCGFNTVDAVRVTMDPEKCVMDYSVARFGPYNICVNGTVTFSWTGMHGLFQIPDIACPSNFTAPKAEGYEYLAPPSNGGSFTWEVPEKPGQYWLTSQWPGDCRNGLVAEIFVTDPTGTSAASRRVYSLYSLIALLAVTALFWLA
ncbi:hypothetical protein Ndes2526B_g02060 [Nannochloris sp. 'desiccata']